MGIFEELERRITRIPLVELDLVSCAMCVKAREAYFLNPTCASSATVRYGMVTADDEKMVFDACNEHRYETEQQAYTALDPEWKAKAELENVSYGSMMPIPMAATLANNLSIGTAGPSLSNELK